MTEASGSGTLGVVSALSARLAEDGHEVALAYGSRPETPADLRESLPDAVELFPLPWHRRTPRAQVAAAAALRRIARETNPDVVHLHSSFAGTVGSLALGGFPKVYTPHGYAFARRPDGGGRLAVYRAVERSVARRCDAVAAVSEAEAELARSVLGARNVYVVPNGIPDLDAPPAPSPARAQPLVVCSGRVGPARRPEASARILEAVSDLAAVRWIGDAPGGEDAPLHAAGVPLTGWLDHAAALAALGEATVLLHFSAWDGAPLAVLEAMARDVVVVASDIPANRELLGRAQVCAGEGDAVELIRAVLRDASLRATLLAGQRERAADRGAALMARRHAEVYGAVLGVRREPAFAAGSRATATPRNIGAPWS